MNVNPKYFLQIKSAFRKLKMKTKALSYQILTLIEGFVFILFVSACQQTTQTEDQNDSSIYRTQAYEENIGPTIESILKKGNDILILNGDSLKAFPFFKSLISTNGKTLFTDNGKLNQRGDSLYQILKNARHYALYSPHYHIPKIDSLLPQLFFREDSTFNVYNIAQLEFLLLDGYFKMGAHLNKGRCNPKTFLPEWNTTKLDSNWVEILTRGHQDQNYRAALESLEPTHPDYKALMIEFRNYLSNTTRKDWDSLAIGDTKDSANFSNKITIRLKEFGYYEEDPNTTPAKALKKAILAFQKDNKINTDGKLGRTTLQLLRRSKELSIRMMEISLERWRWEAKEFPERYFLINIPSAELKIFEKDENGVDTLVLQSNVVVGKPLSPTPQLSSTLNYFTIYPYWNVPYSIASEEILPKVKADTAYLRKKNFDVLNSDGVVLSPASVNWKRLNAGNFNLRFRQRIGADNSLGIMVFNFPNPYSVYLHDTNSKNYFSSSNRFQSHGCIRLEKYVETAKFLIRDDTLKIPYDTLNTYLATPTQRRISFKKKVPIYIRYYTHIADSTGGIFKYADVYGHDEKLVNAVYTQIP